MANGDMWIPWKWLAGIALAVLLAVLSRSAIDLTDRVSAAETKATAAALQAAITADRYTEIINRLTRIENAVYQIEKPSVRVGRP